MTLIDKLKQHLIKEASSRIETTPLHSIPMTDDEVKVQLLHEATDRINRLTKKGMAFGTGYSRLNNAIWNLKWTYPNIGPKAAKIKADIEANFKPYQKIEADSSMKKGRHAIKAGLYSLSGYEPEGDSEGSSIGVPLATLVMRFRYTRHIKPDKNAQALDVANNAIEQVKTATGFDVDAFISDLESKNIPLNPYFHPSVLNESKGGAILQSDLKPFLGREHSRYQSERNPSLLGIDSRSFYQKHETASMTKQDKSRTKFKNEEIAQINHDPYLLRAIANKVRQGYGINGKLLAKKLNDRIDIDKKAVGTMSPEESETSIQNYKAQFDRITKAFTSGLSPDKVDQSKSKDRIAKLMGELNNQTSKNSKMKLLSSLCAPKDAYHWGVFMGGDGKLNYRIGLGEKLVKGQDGALNTEDLKLLLTCLDKKMFDTFKDMYVYNDTHRNAFNVNCKAWSDIQYSMDQVEPDEFCVPDFSLYYLSNGLDTDPKDEYERPMQVVPMLRKLPDKGENRGDIIYDRDVINMGRNHLVKNWNSVIDQYDESGEKTQITNGCLADLVRSWGDKATSAISHLASLSAKSDAPLTGREEDPSEADLAVQTVMKNRTNAETVYESLTQPYDNYDQFNEDILSYSLGTILQTYYDNEPVLDPVLDNSGGYNSLLALFADVSDLQIGTDDTTLNKFAELIVSACAQLPSSDQCKELADKYPKRIDASDLISKMYNIVKNSLPSNDFLRTIQGYKNGDVSWDNVKKYIQSRLTTKGTDDFTKMQKDDFDLYKKHGYALSKMMDLVSCLMYVSCGEKLRKGEKGKRGLNRIHPTDQFNKMFGRHYSTSSGKGNGGQIIIGLEYAFNAGEVVANPTDPRLSAQEKADAIYMQKRVNEERRKRHDVYGIRPKKTTYRKTFHGERLETRTIVINGEEVEIGQHALFGKGDPPDWLQWSTAALQSARDIYGETLPEGAQPIKTGTRVRTMKIVERLQYFIGQAGSEEGMVKKLESYSNWTAAKSDFEKRYPTLLNELNMIMMPLNARLDLLEVSAKLAIDRVRKGLERNPPPALDAVSDEHPKHTVFEVVLQQADGDIVVLSSQGIADQVDELKNSINKIKMDDKEETNDTISAPEMDEVPQEDDEETQQVVPGGGVQTVDEPAADHLDTVAVPDVPQPVEVSTPPIAETKVPPRQLKPVTPVPPPVVNQTPATSVPPPADKIPEVGIKNKRKLKPLPINDNSKSYISKNKPKRTLLKDPSKKRSSTVEVFEKIANELDSRGMTELSNKIDIILGKLSDVN